MNRLLLVILLTGLIGYGLAASAQGGNSGHNSGTHSRIPTLRINSTDKSIEGNLNHGDSIQKYHFNAEAGTTYLFYSTGEVDVKLEVRNGSGEEVASDDDSGDDTNFWLFFRPELSDSYMLQISGYEGAQGQFDLHYSKVTINFLEIGLREKSIAGNIRVAGGIEWYSFSLEPGYIYTFKSSGSTDVFAKLLDETGSEFYKEDDDSGEGANFFFEYPAQRSAEYLLRINAVENNRGAYTLHYFKTAIPQDSTEPNNSVSQAKTIIIGENVSTLSGSLHRADDEDWFSFRAIPGKTYVLYSEGTTDVTVNLCDAEGEMLAQDDDQGDENNFRLEHFLEDNAIYTVQIKGYDGAIGDYRFFYRYRTDEVDAYEPDNNASQCTYLNLSDDFASQDHNFKTPTDQDWYRFEAEAGKIYRFYSTGEIDNQIALYEDDGETLIDSDDDDGEGNNFSLRFKADEAGFYKLKVTGYEGALGDYKLFFGINDEVAESTGGDSYEPDNEASSATRLTVGTGEQRQAHSIHRADDEDWFVIRLEEGRSYHFESDAEFDTMIEIYSADGSALVASDDDSGDASNFSVEFEPQTSGDYLIKIIGYGEETGDYSLVY